MKKPLRAGARPGDGVRVGLAKDALSTAGACRGTWGRAGGRLSLSTPHPWTRGADTWCMRRCGRGPFAFPSRLLRLLGLALSVVNRGHHGDHGHTPHPATRAHRSCVCVCARARTQTCEAVSIIHGRSPVTRAWARGAAPGHLLRASGQGFSPDRQTPVRARLCEDPGSACAWTG